MLRVIFTGLVIMLPLLRWWLINLKSHHKKQLLESRLELWNKQVMAAGLSELVDFPCKFFQRDGWCMMDQPELECPCSFNDYGPLFGETVNDD